MKRVSFFIPHQGCPQNCIFCDQHSISGKENSPSFSQVAETLKKAALYNDSDVSQIQIAFFGGSFTAIDKSLMKGYLEVAKEACEKYGYEGIRFSTRPDCIYPEIMMELEKYPIVHIEIGLQSLEDEVLTLNNRGHKQQDTLTAVQLLKKHAVPFTLQMMVGLYGDIEEGAIETGRKIVELAPDSVRIYPTLVLKGTQLEELYTWGTYIPLSLKDALRVCGTLYQMFQDANIPVIRLGLHEDEGLLQGYTAGPHHPAFGELCKGYALYKKTAPLLQSKKNILYVHPRNLSLLTGHGGWVKKKLEKQGVLIIIKTDDSLDFSREEVKVE